jgi:DNA modification methylase
MISKYIEEFSKRGDLILDPFGGSGNIIRTALMLERRAIYVDLNPFAKLVAESTIVGCSLENLVKAVKDVIEEEKFRN